MIDDDVPFDERPTPPIDDSDEIRVQRTRPAEIDFGLDGPVTDPIEWLEKDLDADGRDLVHRSARSEGDGTPWAQFLKMVDRVDVRERRWRRAFRWLRDELATIRKVISPEWLKELGDVTGTVRMARRIAIAAAGLLAASLVTLYSSYRDHEQTVGADKVRLERLEQDVKEQHHELEHAIDQIRAELSRRSQIDQPTNISRVDDQLASKGNLP